MRPPQGLGLIEAIGTAAHSLPPIRSRSGSGSSSSRNRGACATCSVVDTGRRTLSYGKENVVPGQRETGPKLQDWDRGVHPLKETGCRRRADQRRRKKTS